MKRHLSVLLLLSLIMANLASCGGSAPSADTTAASGGDPAAADTTAASDEYDFPDIDLGGKSFVIANSETGSWGHYYHVDFEEATGDALDDAVFTRNRSLEEKFNLKLEIFEENIDTLYSTLQTAILAGDDMCDIAYVRSNKLATMITDGYLYDLSTLDGLNLDEDWWDQAVVSNARVGTDRALFFASHYFSLMSFDGSICTYFNESMLEDLNMDPPYELVRQGKWTLDEMFKYTAAGANLNGDESFAWSDTGNSIYGLATWNNGYYGLLYGCNAPFSATDKNGTPSITAGSEHFVDVCEKLATGLMSKEGEFIEKNTGNTPAHYEEMFRNGRALMLVAQVKTSGKYRDIDDTFGIVPLPKYDTAQKDYISLMPASCAFMCIPKTNPDAEQTAKLIDAFSYVSYRDVLPIYYEVNVSQKGLRNEDSIEMLDIIRKSRVCEIGNIFGWTSTMQTNIYNKLAAGSGDVMSVIDADKPAAQAAVEATMKLLEE